MHLNISLPLLSELEQYQRAFWNQHALRQDASARRSPDRLAPDPQGSNGACVCLRPPVGSPDEDSHRPDHGPALKSQQEGHEQDHRGEPRSDPTDSEGVTEEQVVGPSRDRSPSPQQESPEGDLNADACSTCEKNPHSACPDAGTEPSQGPQPAPSQVGGRVHRTRRECRVFVGQDHGAQLVPVTLRPCGCLQVETTTLLLPSYSEASAFTRPSTCNVIPVFNALCRLKDRD